jgi:hypothetical protein
MKTFLFLFVFLFTITNIFSQDFVNKSKPFTILVQKQYDMTNIKDSLIFMDKNEVLKNGIKILIPDSTRKNIKGKIVSEYTMIAYNKATTNNKFFLGHGKINNKEEYDEFFYGGIEFSKYTNSDTDLLDINFFEVFDALQLYHFIQVKMPNGEKETITFTVIRLVLN